MSDNNRSLGEQSRWEIFQYLLIIGDYKAAFASLFWKRPKWVVSILYTNDQIVKKKFKHRTDAHNYVANEGDHVANYTIYQEY